MTPDPSSTPPYTAPPLSWMSSNIPYLIAVVLMTALGVGSTLLVLFLRPNADNAALIAAIAGFIAPTTMALLAFMKTQETHVLVNGRMDEFKKLLQLNAAMAEEAARKAGVVQGQTNRTPL